MAQKWTRAHEARREEILDLLSRKTKPFEDVSEEAVAGRKDLPLLRWCETYLPHYFDVPFAPFHQRMVDAAGEAGMPTFIAAFRGCGKSVLLSLARPLHRALGGETPYLIFGSQVQKLAAQIMDYIRLELEHNERIRCDYGDLRVSGAEEVWTVSMPHGRSRKGRFARTRCKLEAFGIGMSPRGRRFRQYRPVDFIGDDLESAELARNPEREQNLWDWMMDEVIPALEPGKFTFTVLGTMFGPGCMMVRAQEKAKEADAQGRPLVRTFLQKATEGGRSVWPQRFSNQDLDRVRRMIGLRNWMRNFDLCADDPTKPFQAGWMGEYDEAKLDRSALDVVAFLDPAISERATGCPRALIVVGADRRTGIRNVLDAWIERGSPMEMVDRVIAVNGRFRPRVIGIEKNGGYALIRPLLEMRARDFIPARYINHTRPKDIRIESLSPAFEAGRWRFPKNPNRGVRTLIDQFLNYPDGFVDGPDAAAGCDELLPDTFRPAGEGVPYVRVTGRRDYACV